MSFNLHEILSQELNLQQIMICHSILSLLFGLIAIFLPHNFYSIELTYNHLAHEYLRMYGALTLSIGWFVWRTQEITDGRIKMIICEVFSISYIIQGIVMLRAHQSIGISNGHNFIHWMMAFMFLTIGSLYGYMRFVKKIKIFELPGGRES